MGASGQKVTNLQTVLKSLGADIVVDGHFGSTTRDAVKAFQREHNLKVDGKLGVNDAKVFGQAIQAKDAQQAMTTLAQLNQRGLQLTDHQDGNNTSSNDNSAAIQALQDAKPKTYNLKQGAQGEHVHQIQLALNQLGHDVPANGLFDKTTQDAVKAFQKEHGLQPDGAMSPKDTWQLAQAVDNHQRVQAQLVEQKQRMVATESIATPVNQPDVNTPAAAAVSQSAQPIVLSPTIAKLHEQITHHLTQGEFGNQLAHLSEKDQQAAIAFATHEATRNLARSVDYVQINKDGDVMMGFDGHKGFSAEMNLKQVQNNEASQVLAASMELQQTQAQNLAMRQEQSRYQKAA